MINISILGTGNVATHLCKAFKASKEVTLVQVYSRTATRLKNLPENTKLVNELSSLKTADVYLIAIPDAHVTQLSQKLTFRDSLVVHCSGSLAMESLANRNRKGVFYPLQTFSKEQPLTFSEFPICVEAESENDLKLLKKLGQCISNTVTEINSEQRKSLHLAAVMVNNFVNHLYHIGHEITKENGLSFDLLKPLIAETAHKIETNSPSEIQTGPAIRKDTETIKKHLHLLSNNSHKALYKLLTESIIDTHGRKL